MIFRELILDCDEAKKEEIQNSLQSDIELFHKETSRKNYALNCCNIICSKKRVYEEKNEWEKADGFFCSQLVAAAYLKCGILDYDYGTGHYLPGSFAQNFKNLKMKSPYKLGPEILIEFTQ
jgi:hypothetical protein